MPEQPLDSVNQAVVDKITARFQEGCRKYNSTIEDYDKSVMEWIDDVQEELLDALVYIEKLKQVLGKPIDKHPKKEEIKNPLANINHHPGTVYGYPTYYPGQRSDDWTKGF